MSARRPRGAGRASAPVRPAKKYCKIRDGFAHVKEYCKYSTLGLGAYCAKKQHNSANAKNNTSTPLWTLEGAPRAGERDTRHAAPTATLHTRSRDSSSHTPSLRRFRVGRRRVQPDERRRWRQPVTRVAKGPTPMATAGTCVERVLMREAAQPWTAGWQPSGLQAEQAGARRARRK
eukprot:7242441-Prymnesium_polylepis.1